MFVTIGADAHTQLGAISMLPAQLVLGYDDLEPMTRAACAGDIIEIERLLDLGFLWTEAARRQTPLLYAAANGKTTAVRMMLERGADVGVVTTNGQTVLHLASSVVDDPELTRLLLDYNAPLNTRQTALDLTPLDLARLSQRPAMAAELEAEDAESGTATASRR